MSANHPDNHSNPLIVVQTIKPSPDNRYFDKYSNQQSWIYPTLKKELRELYDQHGVAITKKTVFILNSFLINLHGQVITGKRTGHDQQTRFWQVEICHQ